MAKAVFVDYTGTLVADMDQNTLEVAERCYKNSSIESVEAMAAYWWKLVKDYEGKFCGERYISEDGIVEKILETCERELGLKENTEELHQLMREFWTHAPVFSDVRPFLENCALPVYVLTNIGEKYVAEGLKEKNIQVQGIFCGDMARAYKPHKEIFETALKLSGYRRDQVIHVGDSVTSDVKGAKSAGIRPVLVDRKGKLDCPDTVTVRSLEEIPDLLETF